MISFIIFNGNDIGQALAQIGALFGANGEAVMNSYTLYYLKSYFVILVLGLIGATPFLKNKISQLKEKAKIRKVINFLEPIVLICLLIFVTAYLVDNSYNPFLYFRF